MARRVSIRSTAPLMEGEQWWRKVRNDPTLNRMPLEAALSYPIPGEDEGELQFFQSGRNADGSQRRLLSRITARLPGPEITEFRRGPADDLFPGLPTIVPATRDTINPEARRALFAIYPLLLQRYPKEPARALGEQFLGALSAAAPPELIAYYTALNPDFFDWLRR